MIDRVEDVKAPGRLSENGMGAWIANVDGVVGLEVVGRVEHLGHP